MFDIGFWELTTIAVIALLVIGPDKLPGVARTTGKWVGRARRFVTDVKADIDRELKQEEIRNALAKDAGLDEIKEIMNTDAFTLEEDDTPKNYQVSAFNDPEAYNKKIMDEERARKEQEAAEAEFEQELDEELKKITDHSDAADEEEEYDSNYDADNFDTVTNEEPLPEKAPSEKQDS